MILCSGEPLVATYSIVARDPATGELGVAVQSRYFSVGGRVPWAEAGVGAVATQSWSEPAYGALGLALMRENVTASRALAAVLATDDGRERRQVAMIDSAGEVAVHTGRECLPYAGSLAGEQFSVQGNLLASDRVWPAMSDAYRAAEGDIVERLLASLDAAQAAGGDRRGQQSAAILVVGSGRSGSAWEGRTYDLRVEDHPAPLAELRRLVNKRRAYATVERADQMLGDGQVEAAREAYRTAASLAPGEEQVLLSQALALLRHGHEAESAAVLREALIMNPAARHLVALMARAGLPGLDPAKVARLLGADARPMDTPGPGPATSA